MTIWWGYHMFKQTQWSNTQRTTRRGPTWRCHMQTMEVSIAKLEVSPAKNMFFHMVNRKKYYHWIPVDIQWPATHPKKRKSVGMIVRFPPHAAAKGMKQHWIYQGLKKWVRRTEPRVALLLCVLNSRFDVFFCIGASLPFKLFTEWRPYERQSNAQQHTANVSLSFDMLEVIWTSAVQ